METLYGALKLNLQGEVSMDFIITTDTHFEHKNILEFGERLVGFEELIMHNLENCANHNNILIHLGDVAWKNDRFWNRQLTSMPFKKKWLVKGNHDKKSNEWYITNGWDYVGESITINYEKQLIVLTHKPINIIPNTINIHGHFHNNSTKCIEEIEPQLYTIYQESGHILLALEHHYKPFQLKNIIKNSKNNSERT